MRKGTIDDSIKEAISPITKTSKIAAKNVTNEVIKSLTSGRGRFASTKEGELLKKLRRK